MLHATSALKSCSDDEEIEPEVGTSSTTAGSFQRDAATPVSNGPVRCCSASQAHAAPWANMHGMQRNMAEYKHLFKNLGSYPFIEDLDIDGDNMNRWRLKLRNFEESSEGGKQLNADLCKLSER
jgi:hypothetical protein